MSKPKMKGARRAAKAEILDALTDEDRKTLRLYAEIGNCTLLEAWEDDSKDSDFDMAVAMAEHYLEVTRPDEVIEGTPVEHWRAANATVREMWKTLRPKLLRDLREVRPDPVDAGTT